MARFLAFADTQIGVPTVPLESQADVLRKIVQVALDQNVDAVLHGGDVFEGPVVTPEHMRVFLDGTSDLRVKRIPLLVIRGNGRHDLATRSVHALDVLREVPGIDVADSPTGFMFAETIVCALPWTHPGQLIAHMNGGLTHDQADATTAELLVRISRHMHEKAALAEMPTVLLAHWAISGSALPTGLPVDETQQPVLSWPDLDEIGFDAIIGAHIHEPQSISEGRTLGLVCGSPQQLNFGEHGSHGCWIVEVDSLSSAAEFIPIDSPQFVTIDADITGETETSGLAYVDLGYKAGEHIEGVRGGYVRCRVRATEDQWRRVDTGAIRDGFAKMGAASLRIEPNIIRAARARAETISEDLTALDALAAYCEAQEIHHERRDKMLKLLREWGNE